MSLSITDIKITTTKKVYSSVCLNAIKNEPWFLIDRYLGCSSCLVIIYILNL